MDGKINGKAKKNWQAKKHFGWLGPMHSTHPVWFDREVVFCWGKKNSKESAMRKEQFWTRPWRRIRTVQDPIASSARCFSRKVFSETAKRFTGWIKSWTEGLCVFSLLRTVFKLSIEAGRATRTRGSSSYLWMSTWSISCHQCKGFRDRTPTPLTRANT